VISKAKSGLSWENRSSFEPVAIVLAGLRMKELTEESFHEIIIDLPVSRRIFDIFVWLCDGD
jgi:hypothetical protein